MDPNAALEEARELSAQIQKDFENDKVSEYDANRLAELFQALDGWLSKSGFLPSAWKDGRP